MTRFAAESDTAWEKFQATLWRGWKAQPRGALGGDHQDPVPDSRRVRGYPPRFFGRWRRNAAVTVFSRESRSPGTGRVAGGIRQAGGGVRWFGDGSSRRAPHATTSVTEGAKHSADQERAFAGASRRATRRSGLGDPPGSG